MSILLIILIIPEDLSSLNSSSHLILLFIITIYIIIFIITYYNTENKNNEKVKKNKRLYRKIEIITDKFCKGQGTHQFEQYLCPPITQLGILLKITAHYSLDYVQHVFYLLENILCLLVQQVIFLNNPFNQDLSTQKKCGIFTVCCEAIHNR